LAPLRHASSLPDYRQEGRLTTQKLQRGASGSALNAFHIQPVVLVAAADHDPAVAVSNA
jgi:hypothetical protein